MKKIDTKNGKNQHSGQNHKVVLVPKQGGTGTP